MTRKKKTDLKSVPKEEPKGWEQILSPKVNAFIFKYNGKGVTPELFVEIMADLDALSARERLEFIIFNLVHGGAVKTN